MSINLEETRGDENLQKRNRQVRKRNRHHLVPKCRGGSAEKENLLRIHASRHVAWHKLFGEATAPEVMLLLKIVVQDKRGRVYNFSVKMTKEQSLLFFREKQPQWKEIFGSKTVEEALRLLERTLRAKSKQQEKPN